LPVGNEPPGPGITARGTGGAPAVAESGPVIGRLHSGHGTDRPGGMGRLDLRDDRQCGQRIVTDIRGPQFSIHVRRYGFSIRSTAFFAASRTSESAENFSSLILAAMPPASSPYSPQMPKV
jgi:hypothetical protein